MLLTPDELNLELIRKAKIFHYGLISLIVEPCRLAHLKAMEVAKDAGALLSYDPNLRLPLWPSEKEAREQIMSIWDKAEVIKGCKYYTKNFRGCVDGFPVKAVDTTGAGDSFVGALLCKIVDDRSVLEDEEKLKAVLKYANACGAITTTKKGAIPALPTESEVLAFVKGK
ncbi:probable fructokinase-4 [Camellia sinensis]|nr:probable fructokinase-4 [Camellia sinensis]